MNSPFLGVLLKSYLSNKFSVLMLLFSLVIASCGLASVLIINNSAKQSYTSEDTLLVSGVSHQIVSSSPQQALSKQDYANLRRLGFDQLIAVAQTRTHLYVDQERVSTRALTISGIDTIALLNITNNQKSDTFEAKNKVSLNALSFNKPVAIVHEQLLSQLTNKDPSQGVHLPLEAELPGADIRYLPELVGISHANLGNDVIMDISEFFTLYPSRDLSRLLYISEQGSDAQIKALKAALPSHLQLEKLSEAQEQGELTQSFHLNLMAMALLMFVVCLFIVLNAVNLLLNARMPWLKICRQLGVSRQTIFSCLFVEIILLSFIATCIGILLSIDVANWASPSVQATLENLYGVEVGFGELSLFDLFLQVFIISACGSLLATVGPFIQSNQALSKKDDYSLQHQNPRTNKIFFLFFIVFSILSFYFAQANSLTWLLLSSALLILAGCCLLIAFYPSLLKLVKTIIPARYYLLRLSLSQSIALSAKTKIACCAFFIAVTSNIGMNLMVDSFRNATQTWLESRLNADYYLYYTGDIAIEDIALENKVSIQPRFESAQNIENIPIQILSYPTTDKFKKAMVFYQVEDITLAWQQFEQGNSIFVNQQFAFQFNKQLGDEALIRTPEGEGLKAFKIAGIIYDFGNAYKQVLLPVRMFDKNISQSQIYALDGSPDNIHAFKQALNEKGINTENSLLATEQLLELSMITFNRTFLITDGLNVITLLVAALSLACAIVVLMKEEQAQRMLIRSLGVSQLKTMLLAFCKYLFLCCIALILASPFGMLLSWVLIYKINLQAFQWTYPIQFDPSNILLVYAISLLVVAIVILIPIIRSNRRPLIEDIKCLN